MSSNYQGLRDKYAIIEQVRNSIEIVHSQEYPKFLASVFPALCYLLQNIPPQFYADAMEHKIRNSILEILHRFPYNDSLKIYAAELMKVLIHVLVQDNEDNAVVALKIVVDLHKNYTALMTDYVQQFLEIVKDIYRNMPVAVANQFGDQDTVMMENEKNLVKAMTSFKVLTECPIIIALLYQLHRDFVANMFPTFLEPIINVLSLQPPQQLQAHINAASKGEIFLGKAPEIQNATLYAEYKSLQVKTVSFLAFVLRSFMPLLKPYQDQIADGVIMLMKDCPEDASVTRKELLVAARHLWYTDFRASFLRHIDLLLNDDVLVGTGVTCRETLRPLARSVMIDLLPNLRLSLTLSQISKVISLFSQDLQDSSVSPTIQSMCIKVMLGLADGLNLQQDKKAARELLVQILDCFALRLKRLCEILPIVKEIIEKKKIGPKEENNTDLLQIESFMDYGYVQPIRTCPRPLETTAELDKDIRFLFKSVVIGIKTILGAIRTVDSQDALKVDAQVHFAEESAIMSRVFRDGLDGLEYYFSDENKTKSTLQKDEKEVVEAFASIFTFIEPAMFHECCCTQIDYLFKKAMANQIVFAVPQSFLGTNSLSANFSGPLLSYLLKRFDDIGSEDSQVSSAMLRFFKLLFMALSLFPEQNEVVFRPHLADMIMRSLKVTNKAKEPINYFLLLRGLFRSIGGGKFENLYNEVLPLLQVLLETLNSLLISAHKTQMRELFVELCLTVPVRLSVLLPHLSYLMRPLVIALRSGTELVSQSLKTLELCIDNLNQEFLEPIFAPVKQELMDALWTHLQPAPYNQQHSHTTMRILGKFGGRNRRILRDQSPLDFKKSVESALNVSINLSGTNMLQTLPLEDALAFCKRQMINQISNVAHQENCFEFLKSCTSLFFDVEYTKDVFEKSILGLIDQFRKSFPKKTPKEGTEMDIDDPNPFASTPELPRIRREALESSIIDWFTALMASATIPTLEEQSWPYIEAICRHFALLGMEESITYPKLDTKANRQPAELLTHYSGSKLNGFLRAIVDIISDDRTSFRNVAERVVVFFHECCVGLIGNNSFPEKVIAFDILGLWFASQCYQPEWFKKAGGCHGLSILSSKLGFGIEWMLDQELEFTKALLYVLKDSPADLPYFDATTAHDTLIHILRVCNDSSVTGLSNYSAKFNSLVSLLISELYNANKLVRIAVQKSLELLAELSGNSVTDILLPVKDRLLYPIFAKPLRALPFAMQIGYIEAMTYCLNLRPNLVEFSDELGRLLHEALALADAEDQTLTSKDNQYKNAIALNNLKVECIKLLSAVMNLPEISTPRLASTRSRIITLFFKCLYSKCPEVIEVSNAGLTEVVQQQQRLPKDLLQAGLKPILVNLSDYKKLSVAGLQGLARLLQLLTNYFKVEIGKKLLDHLRNWAEPTLMADLNGNPLDDAEPIAVIAAVLDVFHLLPPAANVFMDELVTQVLELEGMVHRTHSSPFRPPLIRFLNRYAHEAVPYFLDRFDSPKHVHLFLSIVKIDLAKPLRDELLSRMESIIEKFGGLQDYSDENEAILRKHGLYLYETLVELDPDLLVKYPNLVQYGIDIWKKTTAFASPYQNHLQLLVIFQLAIKYCEKTSEELELIFGMVDSFADYNLMDHNFIKQFLFKYLKSIPVKKSRELLEKFFEYYQSPAPTLKQKSAMLRLLVIPMLMLRPAEDFLQLVDENTVAKIVSLMWTPVYSDITVGERDSLNLEIIQLTTLILYQNPDSTGDYHKEAVKFAWAHLKIEDVLVRQAAYVLLCKFIREFETPAKIVTQTYVAQLRAHQAEIRPMVKQALDNLIPALPSRQGMSSTESGKVPIWIQWIRKIIVEDGHSVSQLVSLYQLLIRNASYFYEHRFHFIPQIIPSLARLGLSSNATTETKSISLDLTVLLSKWEKKYLEEQKDSRAMDIDEGQSENANQTAHQEKVFTFLIRFALSLTDPAVQKTLAPIALDALDDFLKIWPNATFSVVQLEKVATVDISDTSLSMILNLAELMRVIVENKSHEWIIANLPLIQKCMEKWATFFENEPLLKSFSSILKKTIEACNDTTVPHTQDSVQLIQQFLKSLDARLHDRLKQMNNVPMIACLLKVGYMPRLQSSTASNHIRSHLNELICLLQQLVNEMLGSLANSANADPLTANHATHIETLIMMLNSQMLYLGELRKQFLAVLVQLIESKEPVVLHRVILGLLRKWSLNSIGEAFPTVKEQSMLAVKMVVFETYGDTSLFEDYMNLVADIYEEESLSRTEMTVRLEHVFLAGMRMTNPLIRSRYAVILHKSLPESVQSRMRYVFGVQNWQSLSSSFWITIALDILLGSITTSLETYNSTTGLRYSYLKQRTSSIRPTKFLNDFISKQIEFVNEIRNTRMESLIKSVRTFVYDDLALAYTLWTRLFPLCWNSLSNTERHDLIKSIIVLLAKDYHINQVNNRPNVIQALLEGICRSHPPIQMPPQLVKYLGKTYNAWHIAIELLQTSVLDIPQSIVTSTKDEEKIRESYLDALTELYSELSEEDYFAGLWRKRCLFPETNAAISYQQCGMWQAAQKFYETAQGKARTCVLPFTESEYCLWERQWIASTQRLQQWDILCDLAKHESQPELLLECAWRLSDWSTDKESLGTTLQSIAQPPTPRKKVFQAFLVLNRLGDGQDSTAEFQRLCDEGIQMALRKWRSLPEIVSQSHVKTFHIFQEFVELHEAYQIQNNLNITNATNIDAKAAELKSTLSTWRDRLPNVWDDMNLWSDLVSWRQHVFTSINKAYLPLIPHIAPMTGSNPSSSFAYRGYHETAWIINRFAHVARKHRLPEICISSLGKIYTLPNIEIQEAFFKLREQAKCHKDVLGEYSAGLDVINNTNLLYFNPSQKAEFFNLRGVFLSKLNLHEEATQAFSSAIQVEPNLPHGWASFGEYCDRLFDENPNEMKHAADALNCYLNATSIYNNAKCRRYLSRILWLISLDDDQGTLMNVCENTKAEPPIWYWVTFIPELIGSLAGKEAKFARSILIKIAKAFPQALHFQLRTAKEDFATVKQRQAQTQGSQPSQTENIDSKDEVEQPAEKDTTAKPEAEATTETTQQPLTPWENIEEIMSILKTAFPLLALTLESMVDQIIARLKPTTDEDIYRLIIALLNDGIHMYISHLPKHPQDGGPLSSTTETSLSRFAESMAPNHLKYKDAFEKDFITSKPNLSQLVTRFRSWRDHLETLLDNRSKSFYLEHFAPYLVEFEHSKFDDIEVPGQYFGLKSSNKEFARIERFDPIVEVFRGHNGYHRRIVIRGHDGSKNSFVIQHPAAKQCRREERTLQLFRLLNETLDRKIETRKRNLQFHLPIVVPLAPQIRLVQDDRSMVSLQEIFEEHARHNGFLRDEPVIYFSNRLKEVCLSEDISQRSKVELVALKAEFSNEIAQKMIPDTIVTNFFAQRMGSFEDFWTLRKRVTSQMACVTFMTYLLSIGQRSPPKFYISQEKGTIWTSDFYSSISPQTFLLTSSEAVPFRLTPNLQHFMTPIGMEGVYTCAIAAIADSLSSPDNDLHDFLAVFIRDELMTWQNNTRKPVTANNARIRDLVNQNVRLILSRAQTLSCKTEREHGAEKVEPVYQTVLDLISQATNPLKLAQMDISYLPQL